MYSSHLPDVAAKHMIMLVSREPKKTPLCCSVTDFIARPKDCITAPPTGKPLVC